MFSAASKNNKRDYFIDCALLFPGAFGAETNKFHMVPDNGKALFLGSIVSLCGQLGKDRHINILYTAAGQAAGMIVLGSIAVKTSLKASHVDFGNHPVFSHQLQITVNSTQADARQAFAHHIIDLARSGMACYLGQFFKDNLPLSSQADHGNIFCSLLVLC